MPSGKGRKAALLGRVLALARPHRTTLLLAFLALAAGSGLSLLIPEVLRRALEGNNWRWMGDQIGSLTAQLLLLFSLQGLAFYFRAYLFGVVGQRVVAELRDLLFASLISRPTAFFDQARTGDLVSRLSSDASLLQDTVSIRLSVVVRYSLQVIGGTALMVHISPRLSIATLLTLPFLVGTSLLLGRKLRRYSKAQQVALGAATTIAEEAFSAHRLVKAFGEENFEVSRFHMANNATRTLAEKRAAVSALFQAFASFLMNASMVVVVAVGITSVAQQELKPGDLVAFLLYGVIVAISFGFLASAIAEVLQSLGAAERVFELLDGAAGRDEPVVREDRRVSTASSAHCEDSAVPQSWRGDISLTAVSFRYPSRPDLAVFSNLTTSFPGGKCTALVGPSGGGKSTLLALLMRLYEPDEGGIFLDAAPLARIPLSELRARVAYVPQESLFFSCSIAENLRYGSRQATLSQLEEVAARAHLLEFIDSLPQKFATEIGPRGIQLSGGQRQRLAIARAMLRNPDILLLDEATSALDSESEGFVQAALANLMLDRTTIVIAHRISTVVHAHKVLVLQQGSIVQEGTHESLRNVMGLYQQFAQGQRVD